MLMVIRFFRAIAHEGQEKAFQKVFVGTVLPMIRAQDGLVMASVGLPHDSSPREFTMVMLWRDMESLRRFAGDDWQTAVIHPAEADLLQETFVHHYVAHPG
jgi:quinol monooxygenase YgiN